MARARNIKPALFKNEVLGVADPLYTLLFEGLWLLADREGRLEDRPLRIKAEVFPYRDSAKIDEMLSWLDKNGFIVRYQVGEGRYIEVLNFNKHQNPHKNEAPSEIPDKSLGCIGSEKIGTDSEVIKTAPADSLSSDSLSSDSLNLIPDSLIPSSRDDDLFARFWNLYPRKVGKGAAEKQWRKLNPDNLLFERIGQALAQQCTMPAWVKDGGQFIPHPSTWLSQRRWEDEPPKPTAAQGRHHGFDNRDYTQGGETVYEL